MKDLDFARWVLIQELSRSFPKQLSESDAADLVAKFEQFFDALIAKRQPQDDS